ncbi:MAG: tRNA lysidine(34) synthetase TilS [Desulfobacterota bacterium]|nr:tRNA lysidine(34) synthetase TilS [Thermodesulfobacteriota bacterium]
MVFQNILETIRRYDMLRYGDHVVVAVSGGADSMCLLHVLVRLRERWNLKITVAHLDHMLRGERSRNEAVFVRSWAEKFGCNVVIEQRDVRAYKDVHGNSLQEAAREVRYDFLIDVCKRCGAQRIALGHTADDQAETVLMHLLRGSALDGLSGMPPVRDGIIIRPLIHVHRSQIVHYLTVHGITYIEDTSSHEQHYLRNKIRHHLLPLLRNEYNPQIASVLTRTASALRQDAMILEQYTAQNIPQPHIICGERHVYSVAQVKGINETLLPRVIRHMIRSFKGDLWGITSRHIAAVSRLVSIGGASKSVLLPGNIICRREYDDLVFTKQGDTQQKFEYRFERLPECIDIPEIGRSIQISIQPASQALQQVAMLPANQACIAYDAVRLPLVVRTWRPGDRFMPLGLGGVKKIQDFFSDRKVPRSKRSTVPILLFDDTVAWVCGYQIDDRFKVLPSTKTILWMHLI